MDCRHADKIGPTTKAVEVTKGLLDRLDDRALLQLQSNAGAGRRAHPRYRHRHQNVKLILLLPGGGQANHWVCTRNISVGGVAFILEGHLMLGSRCRINLPGFDGRLYPLDATVRTCRVVEGSLHEVGVEFKEPIDVSAFVGMDNSGRIRTG